jgi:hypothetical protein
MIEKDAKIDAMLETQFAAGRLYAAISSRPGQVGRCDGYILEGRELEVCDVRPESARCSLVTVLPAETENWQTKAQLDILCLLYIMPVKLYARMSINCHTRLAPMYLVLGI